MQLRVINPNTTWAMTEQIGLCAQAVAAVGTSVTAVSPSMGPASIESHYDEALSVPGILREIAAGESAGADGYVIACFGDPGLDAARELASGPVVGIAEAAMHAAVLLGRSFSIVTSLPRTVGRATDLARHYGFGDRCVSVYACDIPVLNIDDSSVRAIVDLSRRAVVDDHADAIVLGCAGMTELCRTIAAEVGVPVIDGVAAATKLVESLVALGLTTSTRDEFARPFAKEYAGELSEFTLR